MKPTHRKSKRPPKAAAEPTAEPTAPSLHAFIGSGGKDKRYAENSIVFSQGDASGAVFYIEAGMVKMTVISAHGGKQATIALLQAGDFFGEASMTGEPARTGTATCVSQCTITELDKASVAELLRQNPTFAGMFTQFLLARNVRIEANLVDQLFNSSERRLARLLLMLANIDSGRALPQEVPKLNQEQLAGMIGSTRARVSEFMNKFRRLRYIDYDGKDTITINPGLLDILIED